MELNADFSQRVVVHAAQLPWQSSPMAGVMRRMLDRVGDEVARATSVVRYAPGSRFSPHVHTGGEEFFVLDGVFQDEHGDYPAGTYVRNPPQSSHTPGAADGCVIFVKLWQFDSADRTTVVKAMDPAQAVAKASRPGVSVLPLHHDSREEVRMEVWGANAQVAWHAEGGAELFVLDGECREGNDTLSRHSWLRVPPGGELRATAGSSGARVWTKIGGLRNVDVPPQPTTP
ncbi:MAG: cupin domain-containing protein [Gammaproteobacteria bacterium]